MVSRRAASLTTGHLLCNLALTTGHFPTPSRQAPENPVQHSLLHQPSSGSLQWVHWCHGTDLSAWLYPTPNKQGSADDSICHSPPVSRPTPPLHSPPFPGTGKMEGFLFLVLFLFLTSSPLIMIQPDPSPGVDADRLVPKNPGSRHRDFWTTWLLDDPDDPSHTFLGYLQRSSLDSVSVRTTCTP
ncbi:hypothetical protein TREES_T100020534 [Tupaia chinensis]|uniref:Uncharacterized protein n=1 Tax=Tupaia chinensis TaxID=246437 RepID=L9KVI7_TUPCH|nr:hypothetical protein TREES_T100020534 [Tupaia chinensis]